MLRTLRALLLVVALLASYGLHLLLEPLLGPARAAARLERVHVRNAARVTTAFTELRGVFIKLGQVLSVLGSFLPAAYGRALERLQDRVPPRPFAEIAGRLESALGPDAAKRFRELDPTPIAAASLAQVHRAVTADGRPVAVKVLYPGIERLIRGDLAVLRFALPALQLLLPVGRLDRALEQLTAMLGRETDYAQEQRNLARMRAAFAARSDVVVPGVLEELSGPGVLTMTYEDGVKITDFDALAAAGIDRSAVATLLVDCYFEMLFEHRLFHADPHPGNFLVRPGPVLVILDHGAVEEVTTALADGMQEVLIGGISRDAERLLQGLDRMGFVAEGGDRELLRRVGREYLQALASVKIDDYSQIDRGAVEKLSGFDQTRGRLREIMSHVEYPEGYFYVERTLVLLFGLVGQLAPREGLPGIAAPVAARAMLRAFASQAAGEPPAA